MKTRSKLLAPLAALAALALGLPAAASATTAPACGDTVTHDLTLKADLDCSAGGTGGLLVGRDGITIDLNGHTIIGAGGADGYEGIENDGYGDVTIENGTIRAWQDSVLLGNTVHNVITGLHLATGSYNGIVSTYGSGDTFTKNVIANANYAISLSDGSQNRVTDNRFKYENYGVYTSSEAADRVLGNTSKGFSVSTYAYYGTGDYRTRYRDNDGSGGYEGFYLSQPREVVINHATADDNGFAGIYIENNDPAGGYSATVTNSQANSNDEYGMWAAFGVAGSDNVAVHNDYYNCHLVSCNG
jgi:parallel beta-helix repeat protein